MTLKKKNTRKESDLQKLPAKAPSIESLQGTWTFDLGDYYFETSVGEISVDFEVTVEENNILYFEDPNGYELPFLGIYDEASSSITFTTVYLGNAGQYYVVQAPFVWNNATNNLDFQDITGQVNADGTTIQFQLDNGISWQAYNDSDFTSFGGYFAIYDLLGATKSDGDKEEGDDANWRDLGDALFMDGWVIPFFGADQWEAGYQWEVPLQQNLENPNVYRLVDPYHLGPVAEVNPCRNKGYIMFDVSDPAHVLFLQVESGFSYPSSGITVLYCYNQLGSAYAYGEGQYTVEELIAEAGDEIPYTTFENGVVTLSYVDTAEGILMDANFGFQQAPYGGYVWQTTDGDIPDMSAAITFPDGWDTAVRTIGAENNGEVVYYNLQGQKVANPEAGQILIRKQGKESKKVIF